MKTKELQDGVVLNVNKPYEWTSFDVVKKIRNTIQRNHQLRNIKVGHAGSLDPLATGVLIVCVGNATKKVDSLMQTEKEYEGTFCFGGSTPSYDLETAVNQSFPTDHITEDMLLDAAMKMTGNIMQMPPPHSAKKIAGKKAYDLARAGKEVNLKPAAIHIAEFELTRIELPEVDFRIVCSKGTYIRSIAHDIGKAVNSGAHLAKLCRTKNGKFLVSDSIEMNQISEVVGKDVGDLAPRR